MLSKGISVPGSRVGSRREEKKEEIKSLTIWSNLIPSELSFKVSESVLGSVFSPPVRGSLLHIEVLFSSTPPLTTSSLLLASASVTPLTLQVCD